MLVAVSACSSLCHLCVPDGMCVWGGKGRGDGGGWGEVVDQVSPSSFLSTWHKSSSSNYDKVCSLDYVVSPRGRGEIILTNVFYSE